MRSMPETDEEIAVLVQKGDAERFGVLVERYEKKLFRYARKFVSEKEDMTDMVQDVFVKAFVNIRSFSASRRFSPWLYRIAHNEFVNALKKKSSRPFFAFDLDTDAFFPHVEAPEKTDSEAEERIMREAITVCLNELPEKYREPIVLYYFEELQYEEIAEVLHLPPATVGVRLKRAKDRLRELYTKKYGIA